MDAEHRHELKQNDFEELMVNAPAFFKKHLKDIICVVLIIVAAVMYFGKEKPVRPDIKAQAAVNDAFQTASEKLVDVKNGDAASSEITALVDQAIADAGKLSTPAQKALAYVKAADILRVQMRFEDNYQPVLDYAKGFDEKAQGLASEDALVEGMAKFGLALCAIENGDIDNASNILGQIVTSEKYAHTAFPELARKRLTVIEQLKTTYTFEASEPEVSAPAEQNS